MMSNNYSRYAMLGFKVYSSIILASPTNITYDESHLNVIGRALMTNYISKCITNKTK